MLLKINKLKYFSILLLLLILIGSLLMSNMSLFEKNEIENYNGCSKINKHL